MSEREQLLDHGYVEVVEAWGSDERIIEAARMSTQKGFTGWGPIESEEPCGACDGFGETDDRGWALRGQPFFCTMTCAKCNGSKVASKPGDEKLLRYLWENNHATPFEFGGLVVEVRAPIIVFREWHRHRTQSYNEASARYAPLPALDYVPTVDRLMQRGGHLTKQAAAASDATLSHEMADEFLARLRAWQAQGEAIYQFGLEAGVPKELARLAMSVGRYSTMRASANLRNWLGFERLRLAPNAQLEIRLYAEAVGRALAAHFPRTWALFSEGGAK